MFILYSFIVYAGTRGSDVAASLNRNYLFGAQDVKSPMKQKPFSLISSTTSSKTNIIVKYVERNQVTQVIWNRTRAALQVLEFAAPIEEQI